MKNKKYNLTQKEYDKLCQDWYDRGRRHGKQEIRVQLLEAFGIFSLNGTLHIKEEV